MTDQLFQVPTGALPLRPAERYGRWVLHRAGIVNVWQYDRAELEFGGGRGLLRGKNGAGKSKALEVLLPFLLDGDTRSIDAAGRDRTSVYWLMTDGREPGHHVGYVWLELRMTGEDGDERFCTLGAGMKAATSTRQASSWFFVTEQARVGLDLQLGPEVSADKLKARLGSDAVTTAAEHRRKVAARLFGLHSDGRYANLLRLLHRLRDPNIGNRIEAGELATILRDALPPPSDEALEKAAERFDTLDQVRDQLERTQRTSAALSRFLDTYRGYARTVLRDRAQSVLGAEDHRRATLRNLKRLTDQSVAASKARAVTETEVQRLRAVERTAGRELEGLRESDAYKQHLNLADRRRAVQAMGQTADMAEGTARELAAVMEQAAADTERAERDAAGAARAVQERRPDLARLAEAAGLDQAVIPVDDPDVIPAAVSVASGRRRAAGQARALAQAAVTTRAEAAQADERSARSESDLQRRRDEAEESRGQWVSASQTWRQEVRTWADADLPVVAPMALEWDPLHRAIGEGPAHDAEMAVARSAALEVLRPAQQAARDAEGEALSAAADAVRALRAKHDERAALEATQVARPPASRFQLAQRDPGAGAPFYELVEVGDAVGPADRAGLEAALEASGLLDAWVAADGLVVHPATQDIILRPDARPVPAGVPSLADVLVPARPALAGLLRAVGWGAPALTAADGESSGTYPWVAPDGRWSMGPLRGAWNKAQCEYLGAGVRSATRLRRLAELARQGAELEGVVESTRQELGRRQEARRTLDARPGAFPDGGEVRAEATRTGALVRVQAEAAARHDEDRRRAEQSRTTAARAAAALAHAAGRDSLPDSVERLDAVIGAAGELARELTAWHRAWDDLARRRAAASEMAVRLTERRGAADHAAARAAAERASHRGEAAALAAIEQAVGSTVAEVLASIETWTIRAAEASAALPEADQTVQRAATEEGRAQAAVEAAGSTAEAAVEALASAGQRLEQTVTLPGLAAAALEADWSAPDAPGIDPVALARQLRDRTGTAEPVTDQVVLNRLRELEDGLAGGYDVIYGEQYGVKYFHVADDTGRQPLPTVAGRVAAEATAAGERLAAREREVIERFLFGELGEELRERLLEAHDLVAAANQALGGQRTSHGIGAHLDWRVDPDAPAVARASSDLLVKQPRTPEEEAQLRDALMQMIRTQRETDPALGYLDHLRQALDYRRWFCFAVQVVDDARPGTRRALHSRLGLSQGEQRVVSYLALFAAASAYYEGIGAGCPRLLLLDDAFAKVDEPTHGRLLKLLVDLDLDFLITSERMWGCFREVPSLEIYEALREPSVPGVALVHFRWDGQQRHLVGL